MLSASSNLANAVCEAYRLRMDLAEQLFTTGVSHTFAVKILIEAEGDNAFNGRVSAAIHLLVGYALELSLKAAVFRLGGTAKEVRAIGHDLQLGLNKAATRGFVPRHADFAWLIQHIDATHKGHHFRYLGGPSFVTIPTLDTAMPILDAHLTQVGAMVWPHLGDPAL